MRGIRNIIPLVLLIVLMGNTAMAQRVEKHSGRTVTDDRYMQGIGWVKTPLSDNWFIQAQGGANQYFGYQDIQGKFVDHTGCNVEGYLGRWMFPMLGFRGGLGIAESHGFITKDAYNKYHPWVGNGWQYYGELPATNLHGHYWPYYEDNDLLFQKWQYVYANIDAMFNLTNAIRYNPNNKFENVAYLGVGMQFGITEDAVNREGRLESSWRQDPNMAADVHIGLLNYLRLSKHLFAHLDTRFGMYQGQFDREFIPSIEKGIRSQDFYFTLQGGLTFKFNFSSESQRVKWYQEHINKDISDATEIPEHIYTTRELRVNTVTLIDTIYMFDTITAFSAEFDTIAMRRALEMAKKAIEKSYTNFDEISENADLSTILANNMIPYEMVFFDLDKWDIRSSELLKISRMASLMRAFPNYKFLVIGSADAATGTADRNQLLSTNRSEVVYRMLVDQYGIKPNQIQRVYMGGVNDFEPFELNRATTIIMYHPRVLEEFNKLRDKKQAGGRWIEY